MSWTQDYQLPDLVDLVRKLTGEKVSIHDMMIGHLMSKGFFLNKEEEIKVVSDDFSGDVFSHRYTFTNTNTGEVKTFYPVKVQSSCDDGNYGVESYDWHEEGLPEPKVKFFSDGKEYDPSVPVPDASGDIATELL